MEDIPRRRRRKTTRIFAKITLDTVTLIVLFSLTFCVFIIIWGMIQAMQGVDTSSIVDSTLRVFGTELGICGILTIAKRLIEAEDKRIEDRRQRREERMKRGVNE